MVPPMICIAERRSFKVSLELPVGRILKPLAIEVALAKELVLAQPIGHVHINLIGFNIERTRSIKS